MDDKNKKLKLVFTHDEKKEPEIADTYFEDTAKAIGESKIAIDKHSEEEGGDVKSERFKKTEKKKPGG